MHIPGQCVTARCVQVNQLFRQANYPKGFLWNRHEKSLSQGRWCYGFVNFREGYDVADQRGWSALALLLQTRAPACSATPKYLIAACAVAALDCGRTAPVRRLVHWWQRVREAPSPVSRLRVRLLTSGKGAKTPGKRRRYCSLNLRRNRLWRKRLEPVGAC